MVFDEASLFGVVVVGFPREKNDGASSVRRRFPARSKEGFSRERSAWNDRTKNCLLVGLLGVAWRFGCYADRNWVYHWKELAVVSETGWSRVRLRPV